MALHTLDLARIRVGDRVAILGAGCIGLCILQLAQLAGADSVFVTDPLPWRLALAEQYGGVAIPSHDTDPVEAVWQATGHGVDVAIEAAWADHSAQQAAEMVRLGGRLVIAGISEADELYFKHSTVRRKGLTIRLVRRMKHVYPRAIRLVQSDRVTLGGMVSHRFALSQAPQAFALNMSYGDQVVKIIINQTTL
ncbi:zinc-dependent alcohol dehydrogenase [Candidatus Entotheonella palauensis]|uniref:Alcohol dehydrogenase-like C-terminal domain-containing protein n=1 Tax=Candidatus Entotheonella gemina TaxID=1429439 RepID=W4LSD1_9BACT|nr:zinc-binding dehydrogenase [Candidatus Entotheonella palauensis]ETX00873.1 MAG: hypothetical protein ETSY2_38270 [Candidatus Entotheonella gemina]